MENLLVRAGRFDSVRLRMMNKVVQLPYRKVRLLYDDDGQELDIYEHPGYLGHEYSDWSDIREQSLYGLEETVKAGHLVDPDLAYSVSEVLHTRVKSIEVLNYVSETGGEAVCWFLAEGYTLEQVRKEIEQLTNELQELACSLETWCVHYTKVPKSVATRDNPEVTEIFEGMAQACEFALKILASADYETREVSLTNWSSEDGLRYFLDGENGWVGER